MSDDTIWGCVLPFDTDSHEFRRGVEIGLLWEHLRWQDHAEATVHADCAEMVMRIAESKGLPFSAEPLGDDWLRIRIGSTDSSQERNASRG